VIEHLDAEPPEVRRFLADLAELPDGTLPAPSPALAALLEGAEAPATSRDPDRSGGVALAAVALLLAVGTGWAAAANELPAPLQDAIADFSRHHLPFDLPYSTDGDGRDNRGPGAVQHGLPGERPISRGYRVRTAADIDDLLADMRAERSVGSAAGEPLGEVLDDAGSPVPGPEQSTDDALAGVPSSEPGSAGDGAAGSGGQGDEQGDDKGDDQGDDRSGDQGGNAGTHPGGGAGGNAGGNPGENPGDNAGDNAGDHADDAADVGRPTDDDPSAERRPDLADPRRDVPQPDGTARPPVT